ncbi:MAG: DUF2520 domain-containing protein [Oscillospiraceae bacterium]|nr:DUF2520 domain-containing protein [Oscillospiraceae bacterium]
MAVSDRYTGYHALAKAVFTIEGDDEHLDELVALFTAMGNRVQTIDRHQKALYHCAAVTVSNHVLALLDWGVELLVRCGFAQEQALSVLSPLIRGNVEAALCRGVTDALTGPVERGDTATITNHLRALSDHPDEQLLYKLLAGRLVEVARRKHPQRDDSELRTMLGGLF